MRPTPAQILGRAGGLRRAARLSAAERSQAARHAVTIRWQQARAAQAKAKVSEKPTGPS